MQKNSDDIDIDFYKSWIGVVRGQWSSRRHDKITSICYGTGVAISSRIVLSCAHTVYSQSKILSKSFTFIPNVGQGRIHKKDFIYKNSKQNFLQLKTIQSGKKISKQTVEEDIALLFLDKHLDYKDYPKVGQTDAQKDNEIAIIGYPSEDYSNLADINSAYFKRSALKGEILDIEDTIIYHKLDTKTGHSGAPIMLFNKGNKDQAPKIIGIHTHKGSKRNFGVFLNEKVIKRLIKYEIQFALAHQDYKLSIKFPEHLKLLVLASYSPENRENVLPSTELLDFQKLVNYKQNLNSSTNFILDKAVFNRLNDQQSYYQFSSSISQTSVQSDEEKALKMSYQKINSLYFQNNRLINQKLIPEDRYSLYYSYLKHNGRVLNIIQTMIESALQKFHQNSNDFFRTIRINFNKTNQLFDSLYKSLQTYLGNPIPLFDISYQPREKIESVEQQQNEANGPEIIQTRIYENSIIDSIQTYKENLEKQNNNEENNKLMKNGFITRQNHQLIDPKNFDIISY